MAETEEKKSKEEKDKIPKPEYLSDVLCKMYRFAYDSMTSDWKDKKLNEEYANLRQEITDKGMLDKYVDNKLNKEDITTEIILAIKILLQMAENRFIYQLKDEKKKTPKVALVEYCVDDNIDSALITLLEYKLKHGSCQDIVNYKYQTSGGWSSYSYAAIHKLLGHVNRKSYKYEDKLEEKFKIEKVPYDLSQEERAKIEARNKPKKEKRTEYILNILISKYDRTMLLIELMLREGLSTTIKSSASGWRVRADNKTVFDQALDCDNNDVLRLIFKYGVDIDIESTCTSGGSSMRTDSSSSWKPIHTAIEKRNYELTKLIIARGANINSYRTYYMQNEYGSRQDQQQTALYMVLNNKDTRMLKLIFSEHQQKYNGIPDVNKFNCYISNENKPEEILKAQKAARKKAHNPDDNEDEDDDEYGGWDDPRSDTYVNPYVNLYNYETTLHVAVKKGDLERIKLLLIYGADISLCNVKTKEGYGRSRYFYGKNAEKEERSVQMRKWYDGYIAKYKAGRKLEDYDGVKESVMDVYQLLEASKANEEQKKQVRKIFDTRSIWFPDMIKFYPNNMGKSLSVIMDALNDEFPEVIINIIIEYFYNIVEQDAVKEADKEVDITNIVKE